MKESFVTNCHIFPREGDGPLFTNTGDIAVAHLDRYAIIPLEDYEKLKAAQPVNLGRAIKDAHKH